MRQKRDLDVQTSAGVGSKVTLTLLRALYDINTSRVSKHEEVWGNNIYELLPVEIV